MAIDTNEIVTLVYDGDCPMCKFSAQTLRIRKAVGNLILLDAREETENPIILEIKRRQIDLDKTMVVVIAGEYYKGADALEIMANLSTKIGLYNKIFASIFKNPKVAKFAYPILRSMRRALLFVYGIKPIGNLE